MAKSYEEYSEERKVLQKAGHLPDWYTTSSFQMFDSRYKVPGEGYVKERFRTIAKTLSKHMVGEEEYWEGKFFEVLWKGWLSPASPVLSNVGTDRGLPISCSGGYVGDSVDEFYTSLHEQAVLSKWGFGCSGYFGDIRPRGSAISIGGKASGAVPVIEDFAIMASKISQGSNRRGATASYLPIDHGDFDELVDMLEQSPDGLNIGWNVSDDFLSKLKAGDAEANRRFSRALYVKLVTGKGYFFFVDRANRARPQMYKDLGLDIKASNLCTEIMLHSSPSLSFSCVLSSMNLYKWDEWKDTDAVFVATVFLDCVVSEFLNKSKGIRGLEKVRKFTQLGRAIGLGVLGFSSLLQKNKIPFESLEAMYLNNGIFRKLKEDSDEASKWLAVKFGEPEWCKGYGVRNTHTTALAPTKSTSLLMGGVSESVFPDPGMVFEQSSAAGGMSRITPEFYKIMKERGKYNKETIDSIIANVGSVQHLDWLSDEEKLVFKTAFEVDQSVILRYASQRQKFL
ncbi:MAG TPA: ribonucleotide reductase N-terminal alpha domain-containing protein, partial [Tissierellaceae bacterium]|nr:ribonucleotide reductase N-terminal alpha domain-containing protein [Tissierellaceae bacterium]